MRSACGGGAFVGWVFGVNDSGGSDIYHLRTYLGWVWFR